MSFSAVLNNIACILVMMMTATVIPDTLIVWFVICLVMANVFALTFTKDNDMETVTTVCKLCKKEILDKQEKVCVKPFVTETNDG